MHSDRAHILSNQSKVMIVGTEWKTISVMACQTEKGDRISVIEQRQREMGVPAVPLKTRYVLGNGEEVMRLHGSSFINLRSGEEYIRQAFYPKFEPEAA